MRKWRDGEGTFGVVRPLLMPGARPKNGTANSLLALANLIVARRILSAQGVPTTSHHHCRLQRRGGLHRQPADVAVAFAGFALERGTVENVDAAAADLQDILGM